MYTEESLITNLKLKERHSINFAIEKYGPALYGLIHNESHTDADSIFIKAFARIVNTIEEYDPAKSRLFTWMYCITLEEIKIYSSQV